MAVTLFAMTYAFSHGSLDPQGKLVLSKDLGMIAVVAANLYVIFFNFSWGPVMWVMLGEMFPNQICGSALAVCGSSSGCEFPDLIQLPCDGGEARTCSRYSFYAVCAVISFFGTEAGARNARQGTEQMEG
jgi:SP family sugar:H+ symporter-like MFS transporter